MIADVDADGHQEVVTDMDQALVVYDGSNGHVEASFRFPGPHTAWPAAAPAIAQVDGSATIVAQTVWEPEAHEGAPLAGDVTRTYVLNTGKPLCKADWPMFGRSVGRDSAIPVSGPPFRPFDCAEPFVARQYRDFLGRQPDERASAFWTTRMTSGGWTGPRVIQSLMDSSEFGRVRAPLVRLLQAATGGAPEDAVVFADLARQSGAGTPLETIASEVTVSTVTLSDDTFLTDSYRNVFGRSPTTVERSAALAEMTNTGRGAWIAHFVQTREVVERLVPEVYVTMSYLGMLGRVPDRSGFAYWVPSVRAGRSIQRLIGGFQRSLEYARRVK